MGWALLAVLLLVLLLVLQDKERVSPRCPELETVHVDTVIQVSDSLVKGTRLWGHSQPAGEVRTISAQTLCGQDDNGEAVGRGDVLLTFGSQSLYPFWVGACQRLWMSFW